MGRYAGYCCNAGDIEYGRSASFSASAMTGGAGRWGCAGDGKSRSCGPRFAPSMALNAPAQPHRPPPLTGSGRRHPRNKNKKR